MRTWLMVALTAGTLACWGCQSTDSQCDEACSKWDECGEWPYDECWDRCKSEGDWSQLYVDCVTSAGCSNAALEACEM